MDRVLTEDPLTNQIPTESSSPNGTDGLQKTPRPALGGGRGDESGRHAQGWGVGGILLSVKLSR